MQSLTSHLLETAPDLDATFATGVAAALRGVKPRDDYDILASVRARHGFRELGKARQLIGRSKFVVAVAS